VNKLKYVQITVRLILGGVFLISSYYKLVNPQDFAESIKNYEIFGDIIVYWGTITIPALELIIGLMLISGFWLSEVFLVTLGLYIIFDFMLVQAYLRGLDISCGCFSPADVSLINVWKFIENAILTFLAIFGLLIHRKYLTFKKIKA
jgi:uncharacterized membrane protein YphA (DoxX/SURF4 family)